MIILLSNLSLYQRKIAASFTRPMKNLSLGKKLKAIRQSKGLTQDDVVYETEISKATYTRIETDKTSVTIEDLEKIAKVLGVTVIEILSYGSDSASELEKCRKQLQEKEKELRTKDKEIIALQKKLLGEMGKKLKK